MIRPILRGAALFLLLVSATRAGAMDFVPRLVRDVDPTSYAGSSNPRQLAGVNHGFALTVNGRELWMYDRDDDIWGPILKGEEIRQLAGTIYAAREESGWTLWSVLGFPYFRTSRLSELPGRPGPVYGDPFEAPLLFEVQDGKGRALWAATPDVIELARPLPLADGHLLRDLMFFRDRSFFVARHRDLGTALWVTDGKKAGTVWAPAPGKTVPLFIAGVIRNRLLLAVSGGEPELWLSDGTARGTRPLTEIVRGPGAATITDAFTVPWIAGGRLFLIAEDARQGRQLWATDGTAAGTRRLTSFAAPDPFGAAPLPKWTLSGRWPFFADDGVHGRELWWTDGTPAGTRLLADLCPGPCGTQGQALDTIPPIESLALPERLLFSASTPGQGVELWVTDGTPGGTAQVGDICAGPCDSDPRDFFFGSFLNGSAGVTFTAKTPDGTRALWLSDGTPENARRLTPPGVAVTSRLSGDLVSATDAAFGDELWTTDGTPESTRLLVDLERELDSGSYPDLLGVAGGRLLFTAFVPGQGRQLWTSDGTAAGTLGIPPRPRGPRVPTYANLRAAVFGERTLFVAPARGTPDDSVLWGSDGTGTVRLTPPGVMVDSSLSIYSLGERAVFVAADAEHGTELWVTGGSPASTHPLDLMPGSESSSPGQFSTLLPGRLIFSRGDGLPHIWITDGTAEGTRPLTDLYPFLSPIEKGFGLMLVEFGGRLFFVGESPDNLYGQLWVSDWTEAGTHPFGGPGAHEIVLGLFPAGSRLFLFVTAEDRAPELWVSDGTPDGTVRVPSTGFNSVVIPPLAVFGDRLVFVDNNNEVWVTDGTADGTFPLHDPAGRNIYFFIGRAVPFAGHLLLADRFDFSGPCYVWDGTGSTAVPLSAAGTELGCRGNFLPAGSRLYFTAFEPHTGAELWVLEER